MNIIVYILIAFGIVTGTLEVIYGIVAVLSLKAFDLIVQIYNNSIIMWNSQFEDDEEGDDEC